MIRRDFLRSGTTGAIGALLPLAIEADAQAPQLPGRPSTRFDVRAFGAVGDGKTIDTPAVNQTIEAARPRAAAPCIFLREFTPATPSV